MLSIYEHIPPCGMTQKKYWRQLLINGGDQLLKNNPDRKKKKLEPLQEKNQIPVQLCFIIKFRNQLFPEETLSSQSYAKKLHKISVLSEPSAGSQ